MGEPLVIPGTCRIISFVRLPPLVAGRFVRRDNRFRVTVEVEGEPAAAHLPNSGRLTELLTPGRACWLASFDDPRRKTRLDLVLVEYASVLVSVDARLPNTLFAEALAAGRLEPFRGITRFEREVQLGESRLDFLLRGPAGACWVEVKSVTLVEDGVARFPDAPTARCPLFHPARPGGCGFRRSAAGSEKRWRRGVRLGVRGAPAIGDHGQPSLC